MNELTMHKSFNPSQAWASALLDALYRNDAPQVREIAAGACSMGTVCVANPAESERLDLLGGIALELHRSLSGETTRNLEPYVRLLEHLAQPDRIEYEPAHRN